MLKSSNPLEPAKKVLNVSANLIYLSSNLSLSFLTVWHPNPQPPLSKVLNVLGFGARDIDLVTALSVAAASSLDVSAF